MFKRQATVAAGSQFLGTEFAANHSNALRVHEVKITCGSESKTWAIQKRYLDASGTSRLVTLASSVDANGAVGASTDTSVHYIPTDPLYLTADESIAIVTTSASAAMYADVVYAQENN